MANGLTATLNDKTYKCNNIAGYYTWILASTRDIEFKNICTLNRIYNADNAFVVVEGQYYECMSNSLDETCRDDACARDAQSEYCMDKNTSCAMTYRDHYLEGLMEPTSSSSTDWIQLSESEYVKDYIKHVYDTECWSINDETKDVDGIKTVEGKKYKCSRIGDNKARWVDASNDFKFEKICDSANDNKVVEHSGSFYRCEKDEDENKGFQWKEGSLDDFFGECNEENAQTNPVPVGDDYYKCDLNGDSYSWVLVNN